MYQTIGALRIQLKNKIAKGLPNESYYDFLGWVLS